MPHYIMRNAGSKLGSKQGFKHRRSGSVIARLSQVALALPHAGAAPDKGGE